MVYPTEPPIELAEEPTFGPILHGQVANSRNTLFFTWARFRATASFRVTPGQSPLDDWAVGFVQRILIQSDIRCYRRLSAPALGNPGARPLDEGPVLVIRTTLPSSGRYPLDGAEWRLLRWAAPPVVSPGVPFNVSVTHVDAPRHRRPGILQGKRLPNGSTTDAVARSSSVRAQFYVTVAARHIPSNTMYPFWHARWDLRARYVHEYHFNAAFESRPDEGFYDARVVHSAESGHDMGANGYVSAPGPNEVPANDAQTETEQWMASCPEP